MTRPLGTLTIWLTALLSLGACGDGGRGPYLNLAADVTYVGRDACLECHAGNYVTYIQSEMGRSFRRGTLSESNAVFEDVEPVYDSINDLFYFPFNRGEDLFIMEFRLDGTDTVHKRIEQIDFIVGSGQHTNSHIMEENGYFYQMPMTWYAQDGKWGLPPQFEEGNNYRFDRPIPDKCMACHNGMPVFDETSQNRYDSVPLGIGCERCHGPGSLHLEKWDADGVPDTNLVIDTDASTDRTIVNPKKLPIDLQIDVCSSCHMQGPTVVEEGKSVLDYRPGMRLADVFNVLSPRFADSTSRFIMASHPDRMAMSACYRASHAPGSIDKPMSCITCHNTHVSIDVLGPDHYQTVCTACHTPERSNECTASPESRQKVEDDCASCHMPVSGAADIPHVRITDHHIRVPDARDAQPPADTDNETSERFFGLESHIKKDLSVHDLADGYVAAFRGLLAVRPDFLDSAAVLLGSIQDKTSPRYQKSMLHLLYWQERLDEIRTMAPTLAPAVLEDAMSCFRLGVAFDAAGQYNDAIRYYRRGVQAAPKHLHVRSKLAEAYANDGQSDEAIAAYDEILVLNPKFNVYNNRGFLRLLQGDLVGAEADFKEALYLDPDLVRAIENLASLYVNTGRPDEARPYVRRLLRMEPDNRGYRMLSDLLESGA